MQTKHLCVLIHIWTKGEVGALWNRFMPSSKIFLLIVPRWCSYCGSFVSFMSRVCHAFASVHCCLVVIWRERADLLALVCDVYCDFVTFSFGILEQVWYLIVSIPDPCYLSYWDWVKGCGGHGGEDFEWGRGKCAGLYMRSSVWDKLVVVWGVSVDTTILHAHRFLSTPACTACTDMVYSRELERDVTTTAMAKALLRLKTLASFLHRTWSVQFFTSKGRIWALMYMPGVKCSCSDLKLAICILSSFWHKTKEILFWVRFGYGSHLKATLFSTWRLACLAR